jgi:transcriptional regulator with XRE-family HTH domain
MKEPLKRFGERVRQFRVAAGLSQEQLADRCGLHRTYIGGVERGERNVGLLNVYAIAAALREPVEKLFTGGKPFVRTAVRSIGGAKRQSNGHAV